MDAIAITVMQAALWAACWPRIVDVWAAQVLRQWPGRGLGVRHAH